MALMRLFTTKAEEHVIHSAVSRFISGQYTKTRQHNDRVSHTSVAADTSVPVSICSACLFFHGPAVLLQKDASVLCDW
jgi:hypothetical protein